jgi:hypothetical protein
MATTGRPGVVIQLQAREDQPLEVATIHQAWDGIQIDGETNDSN